MENDVLYNRIMNVIHEEYGEGSTAVANPEGEPTGDLSSIQIGDEIYGISGGTDRFIEVHVAVDENAGTSTLDKTWKEIFDAIGDGKIPFYVRTVESSDPYLRNVLFYTCTHAGYLNDDGVFYVYFHDIALNPVDLKGFITGVKYETDNENGYPVVEN